MAFFLLVEGDSFVKEEVAGRNAADKEQKNHQRKRAV